MNNYYLIGGKRKCTSLNSNQFYIAGHLTKKNPERETSAIAGWVVDNRQLAEISGKQEKNRMYLGVVYHGFSSPLSLKLTLEESTGDWVGKYCNDHDKGNVGTVRLKIVPLEEEVKFVPSSYQGLPKNLSKKKNL